MSFGEQKTACPRCRARQCLVAVVIAGMLITPGPARTSPNDFEGGSSLRVAHVPESAVGIVVPTAEAGPGGRQNVSGNLPLTENDFVWLRAALAYFVGAPPAPPQAPVPAPGQSPNGAGAQGGGDRPAGARAPSTGAAVPLVPNRAGTKVATPWTMGDQVAALVLARRLGLLDAREFGRRFTALVAFINRMPLGPDGMPNRFYDTDSGATLRGDLQPGVAGWSAVDTGRLLLWLRIAAEAHPEFAPFIRNAVARFSVCRILSPEGRLQLGTTGAEGTQLTPETPRGYDAYAAQGYRAWGLDLPLPTRPETSPFVIEVQGITFPLTEDVGNQAPVMTTPPAYLGLEFGFRPIGDTADEVAGGRTAEELMAAVADVQAKRYVESGLPSARAEFRRGEEPTTILGTILANGYPWSIVEPGGALRRDLALISTRAAFALDAFADDPNADILLQFVHDLFDPAAGWYEGRYESTGAYETTRTSATNAFVMEVLAWQHLGPLFPDGARPAALGPSAPGPDGACRLPLAVAGPPL